MYKQEDIFALLKIVKKRNLKLGKSGGIITIGDFLLEE